MNGIEIAMDEARDHVRSRSAEILGALGERLGATARVEAVFGAPVEKDGVTVIPVAGVTWTGGASGGGGSSNESSKVADGEGGGGGGRATGRPAGFICIVAGDAEYVPIPDPYLPVKLALAGGFTTWLVLRGLRKLVR